MIHHLGLYWGVIITNLHLNNNLIFFNVFSFFEKLVYICRTKIINFTKNENRMKTILTKQDILQLIAASSEKFDAALQKSNEAAEKRNAEFDAALQKSNAELRQQMKELNKKMGDLTDTMGEFAEGQVKPKILEMFRERGIELEETHEHVKIKKNGKLYVEIDLLLVNTKFMIVLEVKNTLQQKHIDEHLKRLDKLKTFCPSSMKGFRLLGAVAGMVVCESVEKYAFKKGFFVIRPKGEGIIISNKRNFKFQEWKIEK